MLLSHGHARNTQLSDQSLCGPEKIRACFLERPRATPAMSRDADATVDILNLEIFTAELVCWHYTVKPVTLSVVSSESPENCFTTQITVNLTSVKRRCPSELFFIVFDLYFKNGYLAKFTILLYVWIFLPKHIENHANCLSVKFMWSHCVAFFYQLKPELVSCSL